MLSTRTARYKNQSIPVKKGKKIKIITGIKVRLSMTYIMQDQVGMILRIKWVCFEKAEPRSTDQLHAKVGASAKKKML